MFLPEVVPTMAAQMVARIANERMVIEVWVGVCSARNVRWWLCNVVVSWWISLLKARRQQSNSGTPKIMPGTHLDL